MNTLENEFFNISCVLAKFKHDEVTTSTTEWKILLRATKSVSQLTSTMVANSFLLSIPNAITPWTVLRFASL